MKLEALNQVHIKWFINLSYFIIQILHVTLQPDTPIQGCHLKKMTENVGKDVTCQVYCIIARNVHGKKSTIQAAI